MDNWDDHRFFLALARSSSIKKTAEVLGVNRSTVLRRITAFEERMGVRLFERLPNGYFTTAAGDEMIASAQKMEELVNDMDRRVAGQDKQLSGTIRISLSGPLASYVLMPDFAVFSRLHPDIKLEVLTNYAMPDMERREADVAIRVSNDPPEDLIGRRIVKVARAIYVGANNTETTNLNWIRWSSSSSQQQRSATSPFIEPTTGIVISDPYATIKALEAGMGASILPCYMGDLEQGLVRLPLHNLQGKADLWILTHKDLRNTARIRKFTDFITKALASHRNLLEGKSEKRV
jgi:DNA-binding transcriptional LysR family regulator